jgi:beta-1,4-mannooligosaccharide phosphorylase
VTALGAHMWISYSPDLRHWGRHRLMLEARRGAWWDANKIGLSPPPIETSRGWLVLYHGVRHTPSGCLYRLGLALFDLENPEKCLLRGDSWIFGPEADYERNGDVNDVVFPCGYTMDPDGDTVNIYYGAADCSIALARASVRALLEWLDTNGSLDRRRAQDVCTRCCGFSSSSSGVATASSVVCSPSKAERIRSASSADGSSNVLKVRSFDPAPGLGCPEINVKKKDPMTKPRHTTLPGIVEEIIPSSDPREPEKAQIVLQGADERVGEIRIANILTKGNGQEVSLKKGGTVKVTIKA